MLARERMAFVRSQKGRPLSTDDIRDAHKYFGELWENVQDPDVFREAYEVHQYSELVPQQNKPGDDKARDKAIYTPQWGGGCRESPEEIGD